MAPLLVWLFYFIFANADISHITEDVDFILGKEISDRINALSRISNEVNIISRPSYSNAQITAAKLIKSWMIDAGLDVSIDCIGNVIGRLERNAFIHQNKNPKMCENGVKTLSIGSHYDSVRNAGKFDGTFGIIAGISVVKIINLLQYNLPFAIEIIAFEEEEGNNAFDLHFLGSQFYSGTLSLEFPTIYNDLFNVHSHQDNNITFFDLISKHFSIMNNRKDQISKKELLNKILVQSHKARQDIFGFIELHIEQGPVLYAGNVAIGVVTSINGMTILHYTLYGKSDHAGTTPMNLRNDALVNAAEIITFLNKLGKSEEHLVVTVGCLNVFPCAVNVIPSKVTFSIDLRIANNTKRYEMLEKIFSFLNENRYNITLTSRSDVDGVVLLHSSKFLIDNLKEATGEYGSFMIASGALHDAMIMERVTKSAMLFTRCKDGISHNPLEFVSLEDISITAKALYRSVSLIATNYNPFLNV